MAKVIVDAVMLEDMLFGYSPAPVRIRYAWYDPIYNRISFEIDGPDVPDCERVTAQFTLTQNRSGDRIRSLTFEPVAEAT